MVRTNSRCFQATREFRSVCLVPFLLMKLPRIWLRYPTQVPHHRNACLQCFVPSYSSFEGYSYWGRLLRMVIRFPRRFNWSFRYPATRARPLFWNIRSMVGGSPMSYTYLISEIVGVGYRLTTPMKGYFWSTSS